MKTTPIKRFTFAAATMTSCLILTQGSMAHGLVKHAAPSSVTYYAGKSHGSSVQVIDVNMNDPDIFVTAELADGFPHGASPFESMAHRSRAVAAMTGAYASESTLAPIGDMAFNGKLVYKGDFRSGLVITTDNQASIKRLDGEARDLYGIETLIANSPVLLRDGLPDYQPDVPRHRDSHVTGRTARMGVGITAKNHLLMISTSNALSFQEFSRLMKAMGCRDALNLDSGASRGMYFKGKMIMKPGRWLSHILVVRRRSNPPPVRQSAPLAPRNEPPKLPTNDASANTISVKICTETGGKANDYCPSTVIRKVKRGVELPPCQIHGPK